MTGGDGHIIDDTIAQTECTGLVTYSPVDTPTGRMRHHCYIVIIQFTFWYIKCDSKAIEITALCFRM